VVTNGENGLLVARGDAESLAGAMIRLADDSAEIAAFGGRARESVVARFDERKVIVNTLTTYRELMAGQE
jgi:glycosyltransferase involved in cell wall biosynthesis